MPNIVGLLVGMSLNYVVKDLGKLSRPIKSEEDSIY